jgi:hypothetical protein
VCELNDTILEIGSGELEAAGEKEEKLGIGGRMTITEDMYSDSKKEVWRNGHRRMLKRT